MVAFVAGAANLHGVEGISSGVRCALNVWLTDDEGRASYKEELSNAEDILDGKD